MSSFFDRILAFGGLILSTIQYQQSERHEQNEAKRDGILSNPEAKMALSFIAFCSFTIALWVQDSCSYLNLAAVNPEFVNIVLFLKMIVMPFLFAAVITSFTVGDIVQRWFIHGHTTVYRVQGHDHLFGENGHTICDYRTYINMFYSVQYIKYLLCMGMSVWILSWFVFYGIIVGVIHSGNSYRICGFYIYLLISGIIVIITYAIIKHDYNTLNRLQRQEPHCRWIHNIIQCCNTCVRNLYDFFVSRAIRCYLCITNTLQVWYRSVNLCNFFAGCTRMCFECMCRCLNVMTANNNRGAIVHDVLDTLENGEMDADDANGADDANDADGAGGADDANGAGGAGGAGGENEVTDANCEFFECEPDAEANSDTE